MTRSGSGSRFTSSAVAALAAGVLALTVAGCGGSPSTASAPGSAAPSSAGAATGSRTSETRSDPCALLSASQRDQLGLNTGESKPDINDIGAVNCSWTSSPVTQDSEYVAHLIHKTVPDAIPTAAIDNLTTMRYQPPNMDKAPDCVYLITVGPNTTLWAQYGNITGHTPSMNHQLACTRAHAAASDMVSTYQALPAR